MTTPMAFFFILCSNEHNNIKLFSKTSPDGAAGVIAKTHGVLQIQSTSGDFNLENLI